MRLVEKTSSMSTVEELVKDYSQLVNKIEIIYRLIDELQKNIFEELDKIHEQLDSSARKN
jgi:Mg2+ and Co2+ transporter CorA